MQFWQLFQVLPKQRFSSFLKHDPLLTVSANYYQGSPVFPPGTYLQVNLWWEHNVNIERRPNCLKATGPHIYCGSKRPLFCTKLDSANLGVERG
jgi:hypothetical protein